MTRTQVISLLVVALAAVVAWRLGGVLGTGIIGGALLGTAVALLGHALLAHGVQSDLEAAFKAMLIAFAAKLFFLVASWVVLTQLPAAAQVADVQGFIAAYAFAAVTVLTIGSFDHLRAIQQASLDPAPSASSPSGDPLS